MKDFSNFAGVLLGQVTVNKTNILNPLIWICCVAMAVCATLSYLIPELQTFLTPCVIIFPLIAIAGFFFFAIRDPDRLHSEVYLMQKQELQLKMQGIDGESRPTIDATPIPNPILQQEGEQI